MKQMTVKEKFAAAEKARKKHRPINEQIRAARGVTASVGGGVPESNVKMGLFIRGRTANGKASEEKVAMRKRVAAVQKGIILEADGKTVKHDFSKEMADGS